MGKISCSFEITDPKEEYKPNNEISGKFLISSDEKKDKKLKNVEIWLVEHPGPGEQQPGNYGCLIDGIGYHFRPIKKYKIAKGDKIAPGEVKSYDFTIKLPGTWRVRGGRGIDWFLALIFMQKTGLSITPGTMCVLPVQGSDRPSSI
ncbi:MAG: hypothetical protein ACTSO9_02495 [Candidatus Helarchaeota archaeon]